MNGLEIEMTQPLKELIECIKKGECILFLGAGVHAPPPPGSNYLYPVEQRPLLGSELSKKLAELDYSKEFPDDLCLDLQRVSLFIETKEGLGRKTLVDYLDKYLRTDKKPSPALNMLASIPFNIFVTTNYDLLLESALSKYDKVPDRIIYNPYQNTPTPDVTEDPTEKRPLLFKMHGDLGQRDSIVITDEDYITFVQRMSDKDSLHPVPQTVRYRMLKWPTLFLGYSLHDYNLRLLFRILRWRVDKANFPTSFSVDRKPDPLIKIVYQDTERIISFLAKDLWVFVPWLYKQIHGKEYDV